MVAGSRGVSLLETRLNAGVGWLLIAMYMVVLGGHLLQGAIQATVVTGAVVTVAVLPPLAARSPWQMLPWELLAIVSVPVVTPLVSVPLATTTVVQYIAVAGFALIVIVELHAFTRLSVTHSFAVLLVVLTTLATAGVWAVVRFHLDRLLATDFLSTNEALMQEFAAVTVAGLVAGVFFDLYFKDRMYRVRRRINEGSR